nr:cysteine proteinase inhibitor 1-like [Malus domestica]
MYHPHCLLLILTALLYLLVAATAYGVGEGGEEHHYPSKYQPLRGGYYPIENLNDPHLREIAEFAVSEYDKIHDQKLVFQKLVRGESQTIAGINYKLVIEVTDSSSVNSGPINYEIIVFEDLSRTTKLESFVRVQN